MPEFEEDWTKIAVAWKISADDQLLLSKLCCVTTDICLTWHNVAGDQLLIPNEMDTDLEQLIKGGPFELSLAADRLGNDLFGINSGAQVRLTLTLTLLCARMLVQMTE